jgi:Tol biopolymer transport system component
MTRKYLLFAVLIAAGCSPRDEVYETVKDVQVRAKERVVDYRDLKVPEESGIQFMKYSSDIETLSAPYVKDEKGVIIWETNPKIDIDPSGKKIAYVGFANGKSNIYIKSIEGGKTTIQRTFKNNVRDVVYSKDGSNLAYSELQDNNSDIFQINASQGAAVQSITNSNQRESTPVYSPDNQLIFFTKGEYSSTLQDYRYYIWNFNKETSILSQFCEGFCPVISKDGNTLYFNKNNKNTGLGEIWSIDLASGQEVQILADNERGFSTPKISPDGETLLVTGTTLATSNRIENLDLYTIKTDGTKLTQITFHPGHDLSPVWHPKKSEIFFLSQRGNEKGKYGMWSIKY